MSNNQIKHGCLLLFSGRENLLLPVPVIKEIVPSKDLPNLQEGFGKIVWRDSILPVFYFPQLFENETRTDVVMPTHMVIFMGMSPEIDYYGVLTAGIPRSIWLNEADILEQEAGKGAVKWNVRLSSYRCIIPNLDYLEDKIKQGMPGK